MALAPGTRLGPYAITAPIGAGGMGEVYKATDARLDRTVAVKVLPEHVASDPDLKQRFEREAKTLAALSHPNICPVFDVGSQEGIDFLVMEYLEGETLEQRLTKGALPLDQALQIGIQIADGLAAAHRAGIIHRDLKPGNVILTKSGAKLLDFGLAKSGAPAVAGNLSMLPTTPPNLTAQGAILGTFQYMAPEQLEGKDADARTDIFAFGSTLYEMLTGRKAVDGQSQANLIGAILKDTPAPVSATQPLATVSLDRLVAQCLAKDPDDRWQSARDVMLQLKAILGGADVTSTTSSTVPPRHRQVLPWVAAVVGILVGFAGVAGWYHQPPAPSRNALQFAIDIPAASGNATGLFAVSPDGERLVFEASSLGTRSLLVREFNSLAAQPLPGTEGTGALNPFWSPDGRSIGFFAGGKLKVINVSGGQPRTLADAPDSNGGSWSPGGTILFGKVAGPLYRISEGGGQPVAVTALDQARLETGHIRPHFLPDGRRFMFLATNSNRELNAAYIGSLDSTDRRRLDGVASSAAFVPAGYLVFARAGMLMARRFDVDRIEGIGEPVPLGEVRQTPNGAAAFSVSRAGILSFQPPASSDTQLVWLTRDGKDVGTFPPRSGIHTLSPAPDHERAVVEELSTTDLWVLDGRRGTASRFTTDPGADAHPVWSPDGQQIAFSSGFAAGRSTLMTRVASGVAEAEAVLQTPTYKQVTDWSPDGRTLIFEEQSHEMGWNVGVVAVQGDRTPRLVVQSRFQERMGTLSPDGRYLAFTSDETGRTEVYVVTFPDVSDKWTISTGGGTAPRWGRDGNELFFVNSAGALMSAPVSRAPRFEVGVPQRLFDLQAVPSDGFTYAPSSDSQRFLVARLTESASTPITVVVNWPALLNK
jgi:serine/threonine protein kinase